jgi:hypothetical protein
LVENRLADVPVGMNLELFPLLSARLSGDFLLNCGAVLPALADRGLPMSTVPWVGAALAYGRWSIQMLVQTWHCGVQQDGEWHAHCYKGFRPVACDLVGFFRPLRYRYVAKYYQAAADKVLPIIVLAVIAVGAVGTICLLLG